jgi:hypothetical protein
MACGLPRLDSTHRGSRLYLIDPRYHGSLKIYQTDRLYRNFKDYVMLEDLDLIVHLLKENEVLSKDSRSHTKFIHSIKVLMAKNYIDNLSARLYPIMRHSTAFL